MPDQTFVSHAQNREDVVLHRALGDVHGGRYIDVGANHPSDDSISRSFYDLGWRGLTVEPVARLATMHRAQRPEDSLFEGVIADTDAPRMTLHMYDDSGLSTTVDTVRDAHVLGGRVATDVEVACTRLDALIESLGWDGEPIHFMTVDTEGAEADVLATIDLRRWRPWVLVIESTLPNSTVRSHHAWESRVVASGYRFCLFDGVSRYYVADEHSDALSTSLDYPACALDQYVTWHTIAARERIAELDAARNQGVQDALRWRTATLTRWAESLVPPEAQLRPELERLERLERETAGLQSQVEARRREIDEIHGTLSWRVTRPLRLVRRLGPRP